MMMAPGSDCATILKRHEELAVLRQPEEQVYRSIARIMAPDERAMFPGETPKNDPYEDIFDSTNMLSGEAFASGLFSQASNPVTDWFDFGFDDPQVKRWGPARDYLDQQKQICTRSLDPAVSNFYTEAYGWFLQTGFFGLAALYQEADDNCGCFRERLIPMRETFIDVDPWGNISQFNRDFQMAVPWFKKAFGEAAGIDGRKTVRVIHAVYANPDYDPSVRVGPNSMEWRSSYVSPDVKDFCVDRHYYENPYATIQWRRRPGRVYPAGPGHYARPDGAMLQEMARSNLVGMQFRAEGLHMAQEEAGFTTADIYPGALLYGAVNDQGKPLLQNLELGEDVGHVMQHVEMTRQAVREAFYFQTMTISSKPGMTATEWLGVKQEKLALMAPHLVRVQQAMASFIKRRMRLLGQRGLLPPPPPGLEKHNLTIEFISPLAKAQKLATGQATMQWVGAMTQLAQVDPSAMDKVNLDGVGNVMHDAYGPPSEVINSDEVAAQMRQNRTAQQQQQAKVEQASQLAGIYADVAHAKQADTRSQQRSKGP